MAQGSHNPTDATPGEAPAAPPAPQLSPEHHAQLARAQQQRNKLNRAVKLASFNAWSFAVLAAGSVLLALFMPGSIIAAALLAALAYNEFRGRRRLLQRDPRAPQTLGINQLVFCALIAGYCILKIIQATTGPGVYEQVIAKHPELAQTLEPLQGLVQTLTIATYLAVLVLGVGLQGLTAWYYFSRKTILDNYLQQTPEWVLDLDRTLRRR